MWQGILAARARGAATSVFIFASVFVALAGAGPGVGSVASAATWKGYVLDPRSATPEPVRVAEIVGDVRNAAALTSVGGGVATLTSSPGRPMATVVLDFGQDVGGVPHVTVDSVSPDVAAGIDNPPEIWQGWSEGRRFVLRAGDAVGSDYSNPVVSVAAPGVLGTEFVGGMRYYTLQLTSGSVTLSNADIAYAPYRATVADYQGHFLSSSDSLNRMWYSGAYTVHLDMAPFGTIDYGGAQGTGIPGTSPQDAIYDGAKRDRAIWTGDLVVEDPTVWLSLGTNGQHYISDSLSRFLTGQLPSGELASAADILTPGAEFPYANTYSAYAAIACIDYYRYTGDTSFITSALPKLEKATAYQATLLDSNGLIVSNDPDYWQTTQNGEVTEYSLAYVQELEEMAWLERTLGNPGKAETYEQDEAAVATAINVHLWNAAAGAYEQSNLATKIFPLDANANAVRFGVAPVARIAGILRFLRGGWTDHGALLSQPAPSLKDPNGHVVEPLNNGWEIEALFEHGDTAGALKLMHLLYDQMLDPSSVSYTGAFWEFLRPGGAADMYPRDSLAHGWSSAPTRLLTEYVLGVAPVSPGYATFSVAPHPATLTWAEGTVPTPHGAINAAWRRTRSLFTLTIEVPPGTTAQATVPAVVRGARLKADGARVRGMHVTGLGPGLHVLILSRHANHRRSRHR